MARHMDISLLIRWLFAIAAGVLAAFLLHGLVNAAIASLLGPAPDAETASSAPVIHADLLFRLTLTVQIALAVVVASVLLLVTRPKRTA
jgi:ABC-type antimicrobial peptide transport system permease subunit